MKKIILITIMVTSLQNAYANRPVYRKVSRSELIDTSNFIFSGWPSIAAAVNKCSTELGRWWVHRVYKGDKTLEGKVVSIAPNNYKIFEQHKNGIAPSFETRIFREGKIDLDQSTSFLFTNKKQDGCIELSATGAQEHRFKEAEIEALLSNQCDVAERGFNSKINSFPKDCQVDSDCKSYSLHPNSCTRPYVGNVKTETLLDNEFLALKAKVTSTCSENWKLMGVCPTFNIPIQCKNNLCSEGASPVKIKNLPAFSQATIHSGCAPHDASSMMIILKVKNAEYPIFALNWWGANKPKNIEGSYSLKATKDILQNKDFSASFCAYKSVCKQIKSLDIKVIIKNQNYDGHVEYKFTTSDDEQFNGNVPLKWLQTNGAICG